MKLKTIVPHSYKFYGTSEKTFSAMLAAVESAEHSIYWESYIFNGDTFPTHDFIGALIERAQRGVIVKVLVDKFGSTDFSETDIEKLRVSGVEIVWMSSWLQRVHRKILVVDHAVAFLGGVNVAKTYQKWLDLHVRTTQPSIIVQIIRSFSRSYKMAGGKDPRILGLRNLPILQSQKNQWIVEHWPWKRNGELRRFYTEHISSATHNIIIVSPLLFPHPWLVGELKRALAKKVRIDIIIPRVTDPPIASVANFIYAEMLAAMGVSIHFLPAMNHAKVLIIDNTTALVGSQNIDALSFDFNAEIGIAFTDAHMVNDLMVIINKWIERSTQLHDMPYRLRWYHKPIEWLVRLIQPVI